MKTIEQYLRESTVTIKLADDRMVIVTVFDKEFDREETFRLSMAEWRSVLLKTLKYEKD